MAVGGVALVLLATVGVLPGTLTDAGALSSGCAYVPIHSGVSCIAEEGPSAIAVGNGTILLNTIPGAVQLDAQATPGGTCTGSCLTPAVLCLSTQAFTAPVTAAQCTGPTMVDVPEGYLTGATDEVGALGFTLPPAFVLAANGTVHIQFGLIASPCTGVACTAVLAPAYVGWQCGTTTGCLGFFGEVSLPVPPPVQAPTGAVGALALAAGAGLVLVGWQARGRRGRRRDLTAGPA
jgi:hypothetical protein